MLRLIFVLQRFSLSRPHFYVEFANSPQDLPNPGRVVSVPGFGNNGMVCVVADTERLVPRPIEDFSAYFDNHFKNQCFEMIRDGNLFRFCYKGKSMYKDKFLGNFSRFELEDDTLTYLAENGDPCENTRYNLSVVMECDHTVEKRRFVLSTFLLKGNCSVLAVAKSRYACRIEALNENPKPFYPIKCIDKTIYENWV
jgi:hypothetical protein